MEPRSPKKNEWPKIAEFLQETLREKQSWKLKDEYPLAFQEKNHPNMRVVVDENSQVISHAVLNPLLIKTPYHLWKVGVVGSVCTKTAFKGKGLARAAVESCIQAAKDQKCDIAILWSDLFSFYEKMEFQVAGTELCLQIPKTLSLAAANTVSEDLRYLESPCVDPKALLALYNQHQLRSIRTEEEVRQHLRIPNSRVWTAWSRTTGQLKAYAIVGKGVDFANYVHEWGGGVQAQTALLRHIRQTSEDLYIILPRECQNLFRELVAGGAHAREGILGMVRIVNPVTLTRKIKKGARALGHRDFVFEYRGGTYLFGSGREIYQTESDSDIVSLVFGPSTPKDLHQFSKKTLDILNEIFPIPFWVWGWDSI